MYRLIFLCFCVLFECCAHCCLRRRASDCIRALVCGYISHYIARMIKSRRLRWVGHVARMEESRSVIKILIGKPTGKRALGRPKRRREDDIIMDLEEIGTNTRNLLIRLWIEIIGEPL